MALTERACNHVGFDEGLPTFRRLATLKDIRLQTSLSLATLKDIRLQTSLRLATLINIKLQHQEKELYLSCMPIPEKYTADFEEDEIYLFITGQIIKRDYF